MADYIDREALLKDVARIGEYPWREWETAEVFALVDKQPAADVAPVRIGFWIPIPESDITGWNPAFAGCDPITGYRCSRCGNEAIFSCNDVFVLSDYCPSCGAIMEANHS